MNNFDTIAAVSTGLGGAVSVIRVSGCDALAVANRAWKGKTPLNLENSRRMLLGKCYFSDGCSHDWSMAVYMPAPHSYTGEDIVEIQCHGGNLVSKKVLEALFKAGAKPAKPGEFTYRAFINGKMDLTQAEAVAELISANSSVAVNLAERQLSGKLGKSISSIRNKLLEALSEIESRLDFGEEELDWKTPIELNQTVESAISEIRRLAGSALEGSVIREGVRIVIAGRPNTGKSSLMNFLLGYERAIVTEIPGTTRDTLEEQTVLHGIPVKLIDTAGIREADCLIENMGVKRSIKSIGLAQIVLWLLDATSEPEDEIRIMLEHTRAAAGKSVIAVWNKTDMLSPEKRLPDTKFPTVRISALTGEGVEKMLDEIEKTVWGSSYHSEPEIAVNSRHSSLLEEALDTLSLSISNIRDEKWEFASVHIRSAISALGTITGEDASPDVLERIFSKFCIGK